MTKVEFREWLQNLVNEMNEAGEINFDEGDGDVGDVWREIESNDLLDEIGVLFSVDYVGREFIFRLSNGLLASPFSYGTEGQTEWWFSELQVNLRDFSIGELNSAITNARVALTDLDNLMR